MIFIALKRVAHQALPGDKISPDGRSVSETEASSHRSYYNILAVKCYLQRVKGFDRGMQRE